MKTLKEQFEDVVANPFTTIQDLHDIYCMYIAELLDHCDALYTEINKINCEKRKAIVAYYETLDKIKNKN